MKTLKKKLAPYTTKDLEAEGKLQVDVALKSVGLGEVLNKCKGCEHAYTYIPIGEGSEYRACKLDDKVVNAYGCERELLVNSAEELSNYPDDDPMDLAKSKFITEHMRGY